jgi:hypothetical protein
LNKFIEEKYEKCKEQIEKNYYEKLTKNEENAFKKYEKWVNCFNLVYQCISKNERRRQGEEGKERKEFIDCFGK